MTSTEQERWSRVKERLRAEVGDDIFSSWFARMDLEAIEEGTVRLSVPTRFLKSWIQSHYAERVLACWQAEEREVSRIELIGALGRAADPRCKPKPKLRRDAERRHALRLNGTAAATARRRRPAARMRRSAARRSTRG